MYADSRNEERVTWSLSLIMEGSFMSRFLSLGIGLMLLAPTLAFAAILDHPGNGSTYSGIGIVSGWKCSAAGPLTIRFNGGLPVPLAYLNDRGDTASACGDTNNGFVAIFNWAILGDGTHTAVVYDNGVEFARSTFDVATLGEEFVRGASRELRVPDFPDVGTDVVLEWQEGSQNFVITARVDVTPTLRRRLYWTTISHNDPSIRWNSLSSSDVGRGEITFEEDGIARVGVFALDPRGDRVFFEGITDSDGPHIYRANLDGSQLERIITDTGYPFGNLPSMEYDPMGDKVYMLTSAGPGSGLYWLDPDGSQLERIIDTENLENIHLSDMALGRDKLYLAGSYYVSRNPHEGRIYWANLDGSQLEEIAIHAAPSVAETVGFAGDKLYWNTYTDNREGGFYRSNLDGSQVEELSYGERGEGYIRRIAVDQVEGDIYLGIGGVASGIYRVSLSSIDFSLAEAVFDLHPWDMKIIQ